MIEHVARLLVVQTLAFSLACLAVRLAQLVALRWVGAGAGYLAWLQVPLVMLAVALPHPAADALALRVDLAGAMPAWAVVPTSAPAQAAGAETARLAVVAAWAAGALLLAGLLLRRQRGFEALVRAPSHGHAARLPAGAGPAVLGLWRGRIVLPSDFDTAFDADERRLILLHEGVHLRRADNAWNLMASALLVVQWFNPVAWWAWRRMRADQEMSCDAAVLREESDGALSTYAGALLKVQGVVLAAPLATSWQSFHPLVERVRMLQRHRISPTRHRAGLRGAALWVLVAGIGGYALRAGASAAPGAVVGAKTAVLISVDFDDRQASGPVVLTTPSMLTHDGPHAGRRAAPTVLALADEKSTVRVSGDAARHTLDSELTFTAKPLPDDRVEIDAELHYGDKLLGSPRVITHDGEAARLQMTLDDAGHVLAVTLVPRLVKAPPSAPAAPVAPPADDALPPRSAPSAPHTPAALPPLPAPPASPAVPTPAAADLPAPPAPPQRAN